MRKKFRATRMQFANANAGCARRRVRKACAACRGKLRHHEKHRENACFIDAARMRSRMSRALSAVWRWRADACRERTRACAARRCGRRALRVAQAGLRESARTFCARHPWQAPFGTTLTRCRKNAPGVFFRRRAPRTTCAHALRATGNEEPATLPSRVPMRRCGSRGCVSGLRLPAIRRSRPGPAVR